MVHCQLWLSQDFWPKQPPPPLPSAAPQKEVALLLLLPLRTFGRRRWGLRVHVGTHSLPV